MGLKKVNIKDWRDLAPLEGWARVVKVYDGDTFWLALNPTNPLQHDAPDDQLRLVHVRLARVNAPEIKGGTTEEREKGKASRDYVTSLIADKIVWFRFGNFGLYNNESLDCYFRQIGEIYFQYPLINPTAMYGGCPSVGLSEHLLATGHARPFVPKK